MPANPVLSEYPAAGTGPAILSLLVLTAPVSARKPAPLCAMLRTMSTTSSSLLQFSGVAQTFIAVSLPAVSATMGMACLSVCPYVVKDENSHIDVAIHIEIFK